MYAIVANGISKIVKTQREVELYAAIYPYPKFRKVSTEEEGYRFLRENSRKYNSLQHLSYGNLGVTGYMRIEYFIMDDGIYYNLYTEKLGFVKIKSQKGVKIDCRKDLIKVIVTDTRLNDFDVHQHLIAIKRILTIVGNYVNVDIIVPDISIFLAITQYKGNDYRVAGLRKLLATRLGSHGITVKQEIVIGKLR